MKVQDQVDQLRGQGFTVMCDKRGRLGNRIVQMKRDVDGVTKCFAEITEQVYRKYDSKRDYWDAIPSGKANHINYQPCFAPGVIF